jgi:Tol biopolymer transport system component
MSINPDGSSLRALARFGQRVGDFAWAPDGHALAVGVVTSDGAGAQIFVVDSKSLQPRLLAPILIGGGFCWSPDARAIAFVASGINRIYTGLSDGTEQSVLADAPVYLNNAAVWGPDGQSVMFLSEGINDSSRVHSVSLPGRAVRKFSPIPSVSFFSVAGISCNTMFYP